jgi:integrase
MHVSVYIEGRCRLRRRSRRLSNPHGKRDASRRRLPDDPPPHGRGWLKVKLGCHTFRATGLTAYLEAGGTLENAQAMAAHESPRTTKLYDRTDDQITLDEVERIRI